MYWYKILADDGGDESYTYVGASNETIDGLAQKAARGEYIHLTQLLYWDRGEIKEWAEWDKSLEPAVFLNPQYVYSIMQFKGDPRDVPSR